ncbi:MAG: Maf family protein [Pseudomonadales bacterium]
MQKQQASQLYLASASPRRRDLLTQLGVRFEILSVDIDERPAAGELPEACVTRLARAKAAAGWHAARRRRPIPVLGADTIVVVNSTILGKPRDADDALRMLRLLSGRTHQVMTAVAVHYHDRVDTRTVVSDVRFTALSEEEISAYWQTGEGCDKAGSYAIQGVGGMFVEHIVGSYSAIVGLPLFETAQLLRECGIDVL